MIKQNYKSTHLPDFPPAKKIQEASVLSLSPDKGIGPLPQTSFNQLSDKKKQEKQNDRRVNHSAQGNTKF